MKKTEPSNGPERLMLLGYSICPKVDKVCIPRCLTVGYELSMHRSSQGLGRW